jgi:hypothetical protein
LALLPLLLLLLLQDEYDDDEDDEDDEWRDGEGDPCPGCGGLYKCVPLTLQLQLVPQHQLPSPASAI